VAASTYRCANLVSVINGIPKVHWAATDAIIVGEFFLLGILWNVNDEINLALANVFQAIGALPLQGPAQHGARNTINLQELVLNTGSN